MSTEEELGYEDAIRQVVRSMQRRHKALQEERDNTNDKNLIAELRWRMEEIDHLLEMMHSLHR